MSKRAIILVRLSSYTGEADPSTSPERQEEVCRAYAAAHEWEVVEVIRDLDVSGSDKGLRLNRPGLVRARDLYPTVDVLLFAKLDRLARNVVDFGRIREEAEAHDVALVSVAENLDLTTPSGRFVATILQAFAEMEAAMISTRTREAVAYLAREGRHRGGQPSFGWVAAPRSSGPGFHLVLDPEKAPVLREAVDRLLAGEPLAAIVADFNARDLPCPQRRGWQMNTLRLLLRRGILRGMLTHHGDLVRGADGLPIRPHEPLVTDAEWRSLQAALAPGRPYVAPKPDIPFALLRGLASCAVCGKRLHVSTGRFIQFQCSRRHVLPGGVDCPGTTVSRPQLEMYVVTEVLRRFGDLEGVEVTLEERADDEVTELTEALDAVLDRLRDTDDDADEAALLAQRKALRARLREVQSHPVIREAASRPTGRTLAQDWEAADDTGKAALLRSLVAVCAVARGRRGPKTMDPSRVTLVFSPTATEAAGNVPAGIMYRERANA